MDILSFEKATSPVMEVAVLLAARQLPFSWAAAGIESASPQITIAEDSLV